MDSSTYLSFINENSQTLTYTYDELNTTLVLLHSSNLYSTTGSNNIAFVRLNENYMLLMDLEYSINKKIYESYTITYSFENIFSLQFTSNYTSSEFDLNGVLSSVGWSGTFSPASNFPETIYMKIYKKYIPSDIYTKTEVNNLILGLIDNVPSNLDTLNEIATFIEK